jgi:ribonuclease BN (tRNA processing enzyme)
LYAKENGVYRYLNIFAKAISGGDFSYKVTDTSSALDQDMQTIIDEDGLVVKAIGVRHGPVPAVAYRIEYGGKSIVFSGDTNSSTDNMIKLATNSDLLIYDTAVMDDIPNGPNDAVFFALHTKPSRIGEVAAAAMAKKLVLSHLTGNTEPRLDQVKELIRAQGYTNDISVAEDLKVYKVGDEH